MQVGAYCQKKADIFSQQVGKVLRLKSQYPLLSHLSEFDKTISNLIGYIFKSTNAFQRSHIFRPSFFAEALSFESYHNGELVRQKNFLAGRAVHLFNQHVYHPKETQCIQTEL